jgi:hypothetical protein
VRTEIRRASSRLSSFTGARRPGNAHDEFCNLKSGMRLTAFGFRVEDHRALAWR